MSRRGWIHVRKDGPWLSIRIVYDPRFVALIKMFHLNDRGWNPRSRVWTVSSELRGDLAALLNQNFGAGCLCQACWLSGPCRIWAFVVERDYPLRAEDTVPNFIIPTQSEIRRFKFDALSPKLQAVVSPVPELTKRIMALHDDDDEK